MDDLKLAIAEMLIERWQERNIPAPDRMKLVADRLRTHAQNYMDKAKKNQEPYEKAQKVHSDASRKERSLKRQRSAVKKYGTKKALKQILADIKASEEHTQKTGDVLVKKFGADEYKTKSGKRTFVGHSTKMMDQRFKDEAPARRWQQHSYRLQHRSELEKPETDRRNAYFAMSDDERKEKLDDQKKRPSKALRMLGANRGKKKRESWEE